MPTSHAVSNEDQQAGDEAGAGQLGQQRAAHRQQHHDDAGEARLGRGAAHLVLEPRLIAERIGALTQQASEVAARAPLDEAGREQGVEGALRGTRARSPSSASSVPAPAASSATTRRSSWPAGPGTPSRGLGERSRSE